MDIKNWNKIETNCQGYKLPEKGILVGYFSLIRNLELSIPFPKIGCVISTQNNQYKKDNWNVYSKRYLPKVDLSNTSFTIYQQLKFALKYEGIDLLVFSALAKKLSEDELNSLIQFELSGIYSRKIWFLLEWVRNGEKLNREDLKQKSYIPLVDTSIQFAVEGTKSFRHKVINNLPGTMNFCPMVRKTKKINDFINQDLSSKTIGILRGIHKDVLARTSAFLLLKDSKASFRIEGENLKNRRAALWGRAIGQAGANSLSEEELCRLQNIVIENDRFVEMGIRKKAGFIGEHDRYTGEALPDHISANVKDLPLLLEGLIETAHLLESDDIDAVISAVMVAFGFVFIHPFSDGNGRIHRYLIHHMLARKGFIKQGVIFPISAAILNRIIDYRKVLEEYSHPVLSLIDWEETIDHNVKVLNDTFDFYRFFDATSQVEFLFDCVLETIEDIIPNEVTYLVNYDKFKQIIENIYEMPDKLISLLVLFLQQNNGKLSQRAIKKEFKNLNLDEIINIEKHFQECFLEE